MVEDLATCGTMYAVIAPQNHNGSYADGHRVFVRSLVSINRANPKGFKAKKSRSEPATEQAQHRFPQTNLRIETQNHAFRNQRTPPVWSVPGTVAGLIRTTPTIRIHWYTIASLHCQPNPRKRPILVLGQVQNLMNDGIYGDFVSDRDTANVDQA